jgi:uncharacterized protein YfcZ (UPF0381/DUF406 family)
MGTNVETENEICESCGTFGEIGYIIKEGDEVAEVTVLAENASELQAELDKYIALASQVCADVKYETTPITENSKELHARFQFAVSAEKIIFELKSRSLVRG